MSETLLTTPLDAWHRAHGARMVPFAGYSLPVQYDFTGALADRCKGGVMAEHLHCRAKAALFDVSHMGQASLPDADAARALERLVCGDIQGLNPGRQRYTLLTTDDGGILDDLMVANMGAGGLFIVVNASRKAIDFERISPVTAVRVIYDRALLALQGPLAHQVMAGLAPEAAALPFMGVTRVRVADADCTVSRSGYTGEDGFEISVPADESVRLADLILAAGDVVPAGLGARDSLRLEAGLCLYGNDLDETTSPVDAGLVWTIGKRRKMSFDFAGGQQIRERLDKGPPRLRVGIRPDGRAPARAHTEIYTSDGARSIGMVTSGGFGPTVGAPVAMGYVARDHAGDNTKVSLLIRGKPSPATIVPLPFVPHAYAR